MKSCLLLVVIVALVSVESLRDVHACGHTLCPKFSNGVRMCLTPFCDRTICRSDDCRATLYPASVPSEVQSQSQYKFGYILGTCTSDTGCRPGCTHDDCDDIVYDEGAIYGDENYGFWNFPANCPNPWGKCFSSDPGTFDGDAFGVESLLEQGAGTQCYGVCIGGLNPCDEEGDECHLGPFGDTNSCCNDLFCEFGVCVSEPSCTDEGDDCEQNPSSCCDGLDCDGETCQPESEPCIDENDDCTGGFDSCCAFLECDGETCQPICIEEDFNCEEFPCCDGLTCTNGMCVGPCDSFGTGCTAPGNCCDGMYCTGTECANESPAGCAHFLSSCDAAGISAPVCCPGFTCTLAGPIAGLQCFPTPE